MCVCVSFCIIFMDTTKWSVKMFDGPGTKAVWHVSGGLTDRAGGIGQLNLQQMAEWFRRRSMDKH